MSGLPNYPGQPHSVRIKRLSRGFSRVTLPPLRGLFCAGRGRLSTGHIGFAGIVAGRRKWPKKPFCERIGHSLSGEGKVHFPHGYSR